MNNIISNKYLYIILIISNNLLHAVQHINQITKTHIMSRVASFVGSPIMVVTRLLLFRVSIMQFGKTVAVHILWFIVPLL